MYDFRSEHVVDYNLQGTEAHYHLCCFSPKASIQMKLGIQSSLSVELPQPMTTDGLALMYINLQVITDRSMSPSQSGPARLVR